MQKSFVLSPSSPQLSVRHDESGSAFTSRIVFPANPSDRLLNISQQKSPASSSMRNGMEFTQLDKVVVVQEQDIFDSCLSNEYHKKEHPCKQISNLEQDCEIQSQGGSGMFFYNKEQEQEQEKEEEEEMSTQKEEKKWNKNEKFFKRMLENNTIMQSAKKERQVQQDNVKQFISQENRYLQTVFGKQYLPSTNIMNCDSQPSNFGTTQQNIWNNQRDNNNNNNHHTLMNSQGDLVKQLKRNSKEQQLGTKIERKGRIFTFQQVNNNSNNTIIESQRHSKDKGAHLSSSQQSISSSSSSGQQQKLNWNQGRSQKSTAYGLLGVQKSRVQAKVTQFIRKCQIKSGLKNISLLNDHRIAVINDLAFSSIENQHPFTKKPSILQSFNLAAAFNKQFHQFCLFAGTRFLALPVLDPSSSVKQLLDLLILIFNLISIYFLPVDRFILAFTEYSSFSYKLLYQILTGLAIADILSRFLIGIYLQGEIILDRTQIARQYLKTHFVLDILSSLPLIFRSFSQQTSELWDILIFLKIYRVNMIMDQQFELQIIRNNSGHLVSFVKVILLDLTIIHLLTSLFLLLGFKEGTNGWIHSQAPQNLHWFLLYTQTFYLLLQLHLTNGSQNIIILSNENEFWFMSAASVILFSMLMYNIKKITRILHDYKKHDKEITKQMLLVNVYLRQKNIDQRLKVKVVKYLQFQLLQKEQLSHQSEQTIIAQLSQNLREQVLIQSNIWFIQQSHILRRFSVSVQEKASTYLETLVLNANEIIFEAGEYSEDPYYYFLSKGSVEFYVESSKGSQQINRLNLLSSGKWFGEVSFLTQQDRLVGARAKERSVVCRISRMAFLRAIGNQRTEYETFKILEEKLKLQDFSSLKLSCWSCCSIDHSIKFCPLLHFVPDVEKIILKEIFSLPQRRVKIYPRKCYSKKLRRSQPKQIQGIYQQFKYENADLLENYGKKYNQFASEESGGNPFISKNYESITDHQEQIGQVRDSMKPRKVVSQYIIPSSSLQHQTHLAESEIIQVKNVSQQQSSKNQIDSQELKLCDTSKSEERTVMSLLSKLQIKAAPHLQQQQYSQSNLEKEKGQSTPNIQGQFASIRNNNFGFHKLTNSQTVQTSLAGQKGGSKSKTNTVLQTLPSRKVFKSNSPFCHSLTEGFDSSNNCQNHLHSHSAENCQFPSYQDWVVNTITSNDKILHRQEQSQSQQERVHTLDMNPLTVSHLNSHIDLKSTGLKQFSNSGGIHKTNEWHGVYSFFDRSNSKSQNQHMYPSRSVVREVPISQVNSINSRDKE